MPSDGTPIGERCTREQQREQCVREYLTLGTRWPAAETSTKATYSLWPPEALPRAWKAAVRDRLRSSRSELGSMDDLLDDLEEKAIFSSLVVVHCKRAKEQKAMLCAFVCT